MSTQDLHESEANISLTRPDLHPTFFVLCHSKCILPPVKRLPDVFLSRVFSLLSNGFYFIVNSQHCFLAVLCTLCPHFLRKKKDCQSISTFSFLISSSYSSTFSFFFIAGSMCQHFQVEEVTFKTFYRNHQS